MDRPQINRFEWLKAVVKSADLAHRAKVVATALALQFANDQTGQINPSVTTLATHSGTSEDTVKRAVADLVNAGWIIRTEGRGRGNSTSYSLVSPGKIVAFSDQEKGGRTAPLERKKGAELRGKGGRTALSYNKDKQSFEQKARGKSQRPSPHLAAVVHHGSEAVGAWNEWLEVRGYPAIAAIGQPSSDASGTGWDMPWRWPPADEDETAIRIAERHIWWLTNRTNERRHA